MQAVILAGGKGRRLAPYSLILPKPLMPIGEQPILAVLLKQLRRRGVTSVVLCLGHLGDLIELYFDKHNGVDGIQIHYVYEKRPLGTAGALGLIPRDLLEADFLMMNGDVLTDLDFAAFHASHRAASAPASISTFARKVKVEYGVIDTDTDGRMVGYTEKPELSYNVSMGIYAFNRSVVDYVTGTDYLDVPDLMHKLMNDGLSIQTVPFEGRWIDIGNPGEYTRAQEQFLQDEELFLPRTG